MEHKLSKEYLIKTLNTANNIYEFAQYEFENLIEYLQFACEFFTQFDSIAATDRFYKNFRDLRRIAAKKLLDFEKVYVLFAHPMMPFCSDDVGEFGLFAATTENTIKALVREQQKNKKQCYAMEIDCIKDFLLASFFIDGYDHIVVWNGEMKAAFLLEDDFFEDRDKIRFECYAGNNGLACKVASYQQELTAAADSENFDEEKLFKKEVRAFAAMMDAELRIPLSKTDTTGKYISADEFAKNVPVIDTKINGETQKVLPVYTDFGALMRSQYDSENYNSASMDLESLLRMLPYDYIMSNPQTIGFALSKKVIEEKIDEVKNLISTFSVS